MRRNTWVIVAVVALGALGIGGSALAMASSQDITKPVTIHVIENGNLGHQTFTDLGTAGPSQGDLFAFSDPLFSPATHRRVGHVDGQCVLESAAGRFECHATATLGRNAVIAEGVFSSAPGARSVFGVTGGTNRFQNARGQLTLVNINVGEDLTFNLIP